MDAPDSYFHKIFPSELTAISVPLSFPKKTVPSVITGDDFVVPPVFMLQRSFGDKGNSDSTLPARSALPLNSGHSLLPVCEETDKIESKLITMIKMNFISCFIIHFLKLPPFLFPPRGKCFV